MEVKLYDFSSGLGLEKQAQLSVNENHLLRSWKGGSAGKRLAALPGDLN